MPYLASKSFWMAASLNLNTRSGSGLLVLFLSPPSNSRRVSMSRMTPIRAAGLSSARMIVQGAATVWVRISISLRASLYLSQSFSAFASIGLSFHWLSGSSRRSRNFLICSYFDISR